MNNGIATVLASKTTYVTTRWSRCRRASRPTAPQRSNESDRETIDPATALRRPIDEFDHQGGARQTSRRVFNLLGSAGGREVTLPGSLTVAQMEDSPEDDQRHGC